MENLSVKICLMWSFVTFITMMFVNLVIDTTNVPPPVHQNTNNVTFHPEVSIIPNITVSQELMKYMSRKIQKIIPSSKRLTQILR